jgi:hypothetical protein
MYTSQALAIYLECRRSKVSSPWMRYYVGFPAQDHLLQDPLFFPRVTRHPFTTNATEQKRSQLSSHSQLGVELCRGMVTVHPNRTASWLAGLYVRKLRMPLVATYQPNSYISVVKFLVGLPCGIRGDASLFEPRPWGCLKQMGDNEFILFAFSNNNMDPNPPLWMSSYEIQVNEPKMKRVVEVLRQAV